MLTEVAASQEVCLGFMAWCGGDGGGVCFFFFSLKRKKKVLVG